MLARGQSGWISYRAVDGIPDIFMRAKIDEDSMERIGRHEAAICLFRVSLECGNMRGYAGQAARQSFPIGQVQR